MTISPATPADIAARKFVADWVETFRDHEGLTLRQAGADSGIPFASIARVEKGENDITLATLLKVARWTGDAADFFGTLADLTTDDSADKDERQL